MTTVAPIDVDSSEAAVLIDFENIRLSWEKAYSRLFRYTDLCWLCELAEQRFQTPIGRVVVFMSDPKECEGSVGPEQLHEMKRVLRLLKEDQVRTTQQAGADRRRVSRREKAAAAVRSRNSLDAISVDTSVVSSSSGSPTTEDSNGAVDDAQEEEDDDDEGRGAVVPDVVFLDSDSDVDVPSDPSSKARSRSPLLARGVESHCNGVSSSFESDEDDSSTSSVRAVWPITKAALAHEQKKKDVPSHNTEEHSISLPAGPAPETSTPPTEDTEEPFVRLGQGACRKAEVFVRVFGYKQSGRRRIQRCCDVAIGNEVTKLCFMSRFTSIFLFSADSDFDETARSCAEAEDFGGVIKYAKQIRILGFSHAFEANTAAAVREYYRRMRGARLRGERLCSEDDDIGSRIHFIDYEFPVIRRVLRHSRRPWLPRHPGGLSARSDPYKGRVLPPPPSAAAVAAAAAESSSSLSAFHSTSPQLPSISLSQHTSGVEEAVPAAVRTSPPPEVVETVSDPSTLTASPVVLPSRSLASDTFSRQQPPEVELVRPPPPWRVPQKRPPLSGVLPSRSMSNLPHLATVAPLYHSEGVSQCCSSSAPLSSTRSTPLPPPPPRKKTRYCCYRPTSLSTPSPIVDLSSDPEGSPDVLPPPAPPSRVKPWPVMQPSRCILPAAAVSSEPVVAMGPPPPRCGLPTPQFVVGLTQKPRPWARPVATTTSQFSL